MSQHGLNVGYADVLPMFGLALGVLLLRLTGIRVRERCSNAALTVTGYLRRAPDPAFEASLRAAFADIDRELAGILGDQHQARSPRALWRSRPDY